MNKMNIINDIKTQVQDNLVGTGWNIAPLGYVDGADFYIEYQDNDNIFISFDLLDRDSLRINVKCYDFYTYTIIAINDLYLIKDVLSRLEDMKIIRCNLSYIQTETRAYLNSIRSDK